MKRIYYIIILFLFSIIGFLTMLCSASGSGMRDIFTSIASSGLFALLIEVGFWLNDRIRFGYLQGRWERIAFYNRNLNESGLGYDDISQRYSSIPKDIRLTYKGDSEYKGTASYEKGEVSFSLNISKENVLSGAGIYQYYITSQSITADIGQYSFVVDKNRKKIYVSHLNILPSGNARGLEIWQRNRARHKIRFLQYWLVLLICIFAHQPCPG